MAIETNMSEAEIAAANEYQSDRRMGFPQQVESLERLMVLMPHLGEEFIIQNLHMLAGGIDPTRLVDPMAPTDV